MNVEAIERIRMFVSGTRQKSVLAASNCMQNGYKQVALEHLNEVTLADMVLKDLNEEQHAR